MAGQGIVAGKSDTPKSIKLHHKFDSEEEKDQFINECFQSLGKQQGVLLASLAVRYRWDLADSVIVVEDLTGNMNIPSVVLIITKKIPNSEESRANKDN